jgi:hypothetical protein
MSPEPNLLNSYLLSWNSPIYDPVRCFGSKPDSILATAKAHFKTAWLAFKEKHGPENLAKAYAEMNKREEP